MVGGIWHSSIIAISAGMKFGSKEINVDQIVKAVTSEIHNITHSINASIEVCIKISLFC